MKENIRLTTLQSIAGNFPWDSLYQQALQIVSQFAKWSGEKTKDLVGSLPCLFARSFFSFAHFFCICYPNLKTWKNKED